MRKLLVIIIICLSTVSIAQKKNLVIEGTAPNLFIPHKVTAGESFFSVGRKYNQTPQAIAAYNNLVLEKGLLLGQSIKVPLTAQNLAATNKAEAGETIVPLYHVVGKSETLFRISNNVSAAVADVRQWNNLSSDNITVGTPLVVGHLRLANNATASIQKTTAASPTTTGTQTAETKTPSPEPIKEELVVAAKQEEKKEEPVVKTEEKKEEPVAKAEEKKEPVVKAEEKKEEPVAKVEEKKEEPVAKVEEKKPEAIPVKTEVTPAPEATSQASTSPVIEQPAQPQSVQQPADETKKIDLLAPQPETSNEGVFSGWFTSAVSEKSLANKTGDAATFKSTSGWQDKKYYVLMNDVPPGTILKISSVDNKVVFAKVLGSMPEMKENKGLLLRLSNSAASYLGMVDSKFPVQVSFYQ